ncbi:MAG: sigma-70 family RNA polymerase sigma factor [Ktedonobacterales bacterium]
MHDDLPDDALYRRVIERDPRALEALVRRYSREMSYFARVVLDNVGTIQDAEECAADLFVTLWQEIDSYDPTRGSLYTWLTMRAKYLALDRRRQIRRRQQFAITSLDSGDFGGGRDGETRGMELPATRLAEASMEGLLEQRERREELRQALESLSSLDLKLVYMRYFQLASTDEICAATGLSRHAIDTRLWRARKALREALQEKSHERVRALPPQ